MGNYTVNTRQLADMLQQCMEAGVVPMIHGSPGIGKSAVTNAVSHKNSLIMIDHRLSTAAPEDQTGLPFFKDGYAQFAPFADLFPLWDTPLPKGKEGWLLFLDEINSASKAVMASAYKLILDRMTGQHKLNDRCVIVAAGNLQTDRAIVNSIGTALQSRMVHLELVVDDKIWMQDVAYAHNYDERIKGFLSMYPQRLMDFRPEHNDRTFCCPRTWEFMNRLVTGRTVSAKDIPLYAGTITSGAALEFITYCEASEKLIKIEDVLADPEKCRVPTEGAIIYATLVHLLHRGTMENIGSLLKYVTRFQVQHQVVFMRQMMIRMPSMQQHPQFGVFMFELAKYLND